MKGLPCFYIRLVLNLDKYSRAKALALLCCVHHVAKLNCTLLVIYTSTLNKYKILETYEMQWGFSLPFLFTVECSCTEKPV